MTLPPATPDGKVAQRISREPDAVERVPVTVRIHYTVGNHDWMYHIDDPAYEAMRRRIRSAMALSNPPGPFPHDAERENPMITQLFRDHRVFARHGDIYDDLNFEKTRDASSLGDAIVVELLNRFPDEAISQLGSKLSAECQKGLRELDNVRPLTIIPVWLDGLLKNTCDPACAHEVKAIWNKRLDNFLGIDFVKRRIPTLYKWALRLSNDVSLSAFARFALRIEKRLDQPASLADHAAREPMFTQGSARFVVYGHTHYYEIAPLCVERTSNAAIERVHINSGTWRAVHELARLRPGDEQFVGYHVMTYLAFFKEDENKGRAFETWSGALSSS